VIIVELNNRVTQLEDEIKILKGEIQAVLLDVREDLLNHENPFTSPVSQSAGQPVVINNQLPPSPTSNDVKPREVLQQEVPKEASSAIDEPLDDSEVTETTKPTVETRLAKKKDTTGREQIIFKDSIREWRPGAASDTGANGNKTVDMPNGKVELTTMVALAQWVEASVTRLGASRTQAILDISEVVGDISPDLKIILIKLIHSAQFEPCHKITPRDYLKSVMDLNKLLGRDTRSDSLLYSFYALCSTTGFNGDG
jgi:archaellum component FlaD/FlaE